MKKFIAIFVFVAFAFQMQANNLISSEKISSEFTTEYTSESSDADMMSAFCDDHDKASGKKSKKCCKGKDAKECCKNKKDGASSTACAGKSAEAGAAKPACCAAKAAEGAPKGGCSGHQHGGGGHQHQHGGH